MDQVVNPTCANPRLTLLGLKTLMNAYASITRTNTGTVPPVATSDQLMTPHHRAAAEGSWPCGGWPRVGDCDGGTDPSECRSSITPPYLDQPYSSSGIQSGLTTGWDKFKWVAEQDIIQSIVAQKNIPLRILNMLIESQVAVQKSATTTAALRAMSGFGVGLSAACLGRSSPS